MTVKKLQFADRCEQGTPKGVMLFRKGGKYPITAQDGGKVLVQHEPRPERRRHPETKERIQVPVVETVIDQALLEQLLQHGNCAIVEE